jgi:TolB-like protein/Tfp pilus assembly protein PilF
MSLFEELKRRKVIRVGLAYLVAAWLVAQVAELVAESFGAPDWFMQMLLVLLALGLPLALFLSWAFDLTPQGLVRDRDVTPAIAAKSSHLLSGVTIVLLVLALSYFVWESRWAERDPVADTVAGAEPAAAEEPRIGDSIAVLPFENFSGNPGDQYFADGLADTLLHKLAQVDQLKVIARNSSFQFKGQNRDIREIGQILGVETVLEGSVQRAGGQVRIIAQLIRAADGAHLWSQSFDGTMDDIFALQDQVATDITTQLQLDLTAEQRQRMLRDGTDDPQAYELLIRAINEDADYDDMADVDDTAWPPVTLIRQALERDPDYAQAWARLSVEYNFLAFATENSERFPGFVAEAERAARKAIELAPDIADGYVALGWVAHRKGEKLLAEQHFRRALKIAPNNTGALSGLALQLGVGQPEEALRLLTRVHELEPTAVITHRQKHFALSSLGRYDEAIEELRTALEKDPDAGLIVNDLSDLLIARKGRPDEAALSSSRFLRLAPASFEGQAAMVEAWLAASGAEEAEAWAELLLDGHPGSNNARFHNAERLVAAARFDEALEEIDRITDTGTNRWRIFAWRTWACLGARQVECAAQQNRRFQEELNRARNQGRTDRAWGVPPMMTDIMLAELAPGPGDTSGLLATVSEVVAENVYFDAKYFLRAGIAARLGQVDRALEILEQSLADLEPGIIGRDIFGLPVAHTPLLDPLRGEPAFDAWLQRFEAQRAALLQRMRQMEARGEIISADNMRRLAFGPGDTGN